MAVQRIDLNPGWQFRCPRGRWRTAVVPGTIHSDLMAHRLLADPHFGFQEKKVAWVARRGWIYRNVFPGVPGSAGKRARLVFEGLDTVAEIRFNGRHLGTADNMHRIWRFEISDLLRPQKNVLEVRFKSPVKEALALEKKHGVYAQANRFSARQHLRKAACSFGWDWGIRLPTSGIWRGVRLELDDPEEPRIAESVLETVSVRGPGAQLEFRGRVEKFGPGLTWSVSGRCGSRRWRFDCPAAAGEVRRRFRIAGPKLWMPRGLGEPNLYRVRIELKRGDRVVDACSFRFGVRTIEVQRKRDRWGRGFLWKVNGVPVWARGANWIPVDSLIARDHDRRTRRLIDLACEANMNVLRVWGGGVYESDLFYDLCDRKGLLVWQDFAFSCGVYPEHRAYAENVRREAEDNIRRLRHHASLAMWCGNNENQWAYHVGWPGFRRRGRHMGALYYDRLLPAACRRLDPRRFYWPGSPWGGADPNSPRDGDVHFWETFHAGADFQVYRRCRARFVSEFGVQAMPCLETMKEALPRSEWNPLSRGVEQHQRHPAGQAGLIEFVTRNVGLPDDLAGFTHATQVHQGEGVKFAVEFWRSLQWRCGGAVYWQLNDVWPVVSWSSVDGGLRPKALHFYARRFFAPLLASFQEDEGGIGVVVTNNAPRAWRGELVLEALDFEGRRACRMCRTIRVGSNEKIEPVWLRRGDWMVGDPRRSMISLRLTAAGRTVARNVFFFERLKDLDLPRPGLKMRRRGGGVEVSTDVFAKSVWIHASGRELPLEDNYFDLLPGERRFIRFRHGHSFPRGALSAKTLGA